MQVSIPIKLFSPDFDPNRHREFRYAVVSVAGRDEREAYEHLERNFGRSVKYFLRRPSDIAKFDALLSFFRSEELKKVHGTSQTPVTIDLSDNNEGEQQYQFGLLPPFASVLGSATPGSSLHAVTASDASVKNEERDDKGGLLPIGSLEDARKLLRELHATMAARDETIRIQTETIKKLQVKTQNVDVMQEMELETAKDAVVSSKTEVMQLKYLLRRKDLGNECLRLQFEVKEGIDNYKALEESAKAEKLQLQQEVAALQAKLHELSVSPDGVNAAYAKLAAELQLSKAHEEAARKKRLQMNARNEQQQRETAMLQVNYDELFVANAKLESDLYLAKAGEEAAMKAKQQLQQAADKLQAKFDSLSVTHTRLAQFYDDLTDAYTNKALELDTIKEFVDRGKRRVLESSKHNTETVQQQQQLQEAAQQQQMESMADETTERPAKKSRQDDYRIPDTGVMGDEPMANEEETTVAAATKTTVPRSASNTVAKEACFGSTINPVRRLFDAPKTGSMGGEPVVNEEEDEETAALKKSTITSSGRVSKPVSRLSDAPKNEKKKKGEVEEDEEEEETTVAARPKRRRATTVPEKVDNSSGKKAERAVKEAPVKKEWECAKCQSMTKYKDMHVLAEHTPATLLPFSCPHCDFARDSKKKVRGHMAQKHAGRPGEMVVNELKEAQLEMIIQECFPDFKKPTKFARPDYSCLICGKAVNGERVAHHVLGNHADAQIYDCTHCNNGFLDEKARDAHVAGAHDAAEVMPAPRAVDTDKDSIAFLTTAFFRRA